jgi:hypothetical protein
MVDIMENSTMTALKVIAGIVGVVGTVIMTCTEPGATTVVAAADAIIRRVWDSVVALYHVRKLSLD